MLAILRSGRLVSKRMPPADFISHRGTVKALGNAGNFLMTARTPLIFQCNFSTVSSEKQVGTYIKDFINSIGCALNGFDHINVRSPLLRLIGNGKYDAHLQNIKSSGRDRGEELKKQIELETKKQSFINFNTDERQALREVGTSLMEKSKWCRNAFFDMPGTAGTMIYLSPNVGAYPNTVFYEERKDESDEFVHSLILNAVKPEVTYLEKRVDWLSKRIFDETLNQIKLNNSNSNSIVLTDLSGGTSPYIPELAALKDYNPFIKLDESSFKNLQTLISIKLNRELIESQLNGRGKEILDKLVKAKNAFDQILFFDEFELNILRTFFYEKEKGFSEIKVDGKGFEEKDKKNLEGLKSKLQFHNKVVEALAKKGLILSIHTVDQKDEDLLRLKTIFQNVEAGQVEDTGRLHLVNSQAVEFPSIMYEDQYDTKKVGDLMLRQPNHIVTNIGAIEYLTKLQAERLFVQVKETLRDEGCFIFTMFKYTSPCAQLLCEAFKWKMIYRSIDKDSKEINLLHINCGGLEKMNIDLSNDEHRKEQRIDLKDTFPEEFYEIEVDGETTTNYDFVTVRKKSAEKIKDYLDNKIKLCDTSYKLEILKVKVEQLPSTEIVPKQQEFRKEWISKIGRKKSNLLRVAKTTQQAGSDSTKADQKTTSN